MAQLQNLKLHNTDIFDLFYPVGSIYETSNPDFNPNETWSGTWERIKGKVIVGVDENDTDFESSQLSGGSKSVTLTAGQMPGHRHSFVDGSHTFFWGNVSATVYIPNAVATAGAPTGNQLCTRQGAYTFTNFTGDNQAHQNLQPYYTAYIWERIS